MVSKIDHILIFNYCMDENDPVLSQQTQVVTRLVEKCSKVTVITGRVGNYQKIPNLTVINSNWIAGKNFTNALKFLYKTTLFLIHYRPQVIFSHMTEVQSFLISIISYFLGIRHYLWYAHTSKSFYLKWNHILLNGIITSTPGSCPIVGAKIHSIGQAIDTEQFPIRNLKDFKLNRLVHIGRFDRSKDVAQIISEVEIARYSFPEITLTLIGTSSNSKEKIYADGIKKDSKIAIHEGWLIFTGAILRNEAPKILIENDIFIHAYQGSLDKTLVEATMAGLPVVTINLEYHSEFGVWGSKDEFHNSLATQIQYLKSLTSNELALELMVRRKIAVKNHSLDQWIEKLIVVLN